MPNPWGTALQVLAGAFGQGASSLGKSRLDQSLIDQENGREDARNAVRDSQWDRTHQLGVDQNRARQSALDAGREETRLGRESYTTMLADRGFPPEVIQAILYGNASATSYLGPDGRYAGPGMRRGTTPARPAPNPNAPTRFPSNSARPGTTPTGRPGRRPPPNVP